MRNAFKIAKKKKKKNRKKENRKQPSTVSNTANCCCRNLSWLVKTWLTTVQATDYDIRMFFCLFTNLSFHSLHCKFNFYKINKTYEQRMFSSLLRVAHATCFTNICTYAMALQYIYHRIGRLFESLILWEHFLNELKFTFYHAIELKQNSNIIKKNSNVGRFVEMVSWCNVWLGDAIEYHIPQQFYIKWSKRCYFLLC